MSLNDLPRTLATVDAARQVRAQSRELSAELSGIFREVEATIDALRRRLASLKPTGLPPD